jgi:hypothetical protein
MRVSHPYLLNVNTKKYTLLCVIYKNMKKFVRMLSPGEVDTFIFQNLTWYFFQMIYEDQTMSNIISRFLILAFHQPKQKINIQLQTHGLE